jgi:hypothetical protein
MTGLALLVLIAILAASSSFVSAAGKVADGRKRGLKTLTKKGRITIVLNIAVIAASGIQYYLNDRENTKKEKENKRNLEIRDSLLKRNYDSSLVEIKKKFDTTNIKTIEMLVKYGYKADSANNRLVKIVRDSSKTKIMLTERPVFKICGDNTGITLLKQDNNKFAYKISFCSYAASSSMYNLDCRTILVNADSINTEYKYVGKVDLISKDAVVSKDRMLSTILDIDTNLQHTGLCVVVNGTYSNYDNSKVYNINEVYYYDKRKNNLIEILGDTKEKIMQIVKANKNNLNIKKSTDGFKSNDFN